MKGDLARTAAWLNERGYRVNNCFQLDGGRWRVNVRREGAPATNTHHYADGDTLEAALSLLIAKRLTSENRLADALDSLTKAVRANA